jgi:hypothetical protein
MAFCTVEAGPKRYRSRTDWESRVLGSAFGKSLKQGALPERELFPASKRTTKKWIIVKMPDSTSLLFGPARSATGLTQDFHREQLNGLFQQIRFGAASSRNQCREAPPPIFRMRIRNRGGHWFLWLRGWKIVNFPPLSRLSNRLPANSFRVRQLIAELLHLLSRLNTGHFRDVVVVKTLRMVAYQMENFFLVRHTPDFRSKETMKEVFLTSCIPISIDNAP